MHNNEGRSFATVEDIAPLTDAEHTWLRRLEKVLKDQPGRLQLIECADTISVVDRAAAKGVNLADGNAKASGVWLSDVKHSAFKLTGVSG